MLVVAQTQWPRTTMTVLNMRTATACTLDVPMRSLATMTPRPTSTMLLVRMLMQATTATATA